MNRRFLHVLVKSFGNHPCPYSLHSINASSFLSIHRRQDRSMDHQEIKPYPKSSTTQSPIYIATYAYDTSSYSKLIKLINYTDMHVHVAV
uniref:Uncharacterized protein n=1 Tax=Oryza rufipogon TaxID=4529 RepID=A0A0E0MTD0_ORYRU